MISHFAVQATYRCPNERIPISVLSKSSSPASSRRTCPSTWLRVKAGQCSLSPSDTSQAQTSVSVAVILRDITIGAIRRYPSDSKESATYYYPPPEAACLKSNGEDRTYLGACGSGVGVCRPAHAADSPTGANGSLTRSRSPICGRRTMQWHSKTHRRAVRRC